ncbi:uncharacterized protein Dwil_GK19098 [Drosophila willistoni]|uniref:MARVEL domain-containing protein n=1 Tax=Drosophila willistoni TaxID=7260 RepID=B4MRM3_DROWI|nr:uncharacterized protein LOC6640998 [Drosophila willistoni]EDW74762.2 uncharacterized protein Dwil_GK19098 [Drosophila willistoni]
MSAAASICIKIIQLISVVAALIIKRLSDKHSERVYISGQKFSREWRLLNTISWTKEADDFSTFIFVGYTFITSVLLLTRFFQSNSKYHLSENILLGFGCLFFIVDGLLIFSTVESLQSDLLIYAYVLGGLSFFCAFMFAIDLLYCKNLFELKSVTVQADFPSPKLGTVKMHVVDVSKESCCQVKDNDRIISQPAPLNQQGGSYLRTDL